MVVKRSFEEITELTKNYLQKAGYSWFRVDSIIPDDVDNQWVVKISIGISETRLKTLTINDGTGLIIGFQ